MKLWFKSRNKNHEYKRSANTEYSVPYLCEVQKFVH